MLGGYGKPMAAMMAATMGPLYAGIILAILRPQLFFVWMSVGIVGMVVGIFLLMVWSQVRYRRYQCIGLTLQYADGSDEFFSVLYKDMPVDMGKSDDGKYQYQITDVDGNEWLIMLDHPLEEVIPRFEDTPVGATVSPILTRFITGALLKEVELDLGEHKAFFDKVLRRKGKRAVKYSRVVYAYATPVKVRQLPQTQTQAISIPSQEAAKALYGKAFDYSFHELKKENQQLKDHVNDLMKMLDDHLPITLRVKDIKLETERGTINWKLVAVLVAAAGAALMLMWYFGILR